MAYRALGLLMLFDLWADRIDKFCLFHYTLCVFFLVSFLFVGAAIDGCFLQFVSGASTWRRKHARCCLKWVVWWWRIVFLECWCCFWHMGWPDWSILFVPYCTLCGSFLLSFLFVGWFDGVSCSLTVECRNRDICFPLFFLQGGAVSVNSGSAIFTSCTLSGNTAVRYKQWCFWCGITCLDCWCCF